MELRRLIEILDKPTWETTVSHTPRVALNVLREMETEMALMLVGAWLAGVYGSPTVTSALREWVEEDKIQRGIK